MRLLLCSERRAVLVSPCNAKLCCVRRSTCFSPKSSTAVSEAAGGVHVPHSVLHQGSCLSLAQICHSQLLGKAHIFPFLEIPKWRMKFYLLTLFVAEEEEAGDGASFNVWPSTGQSTCLWCRSSWLSCLPNLLRMNPAPCVRHQKRVKEQKRTSHQRAKIKLRVQPPVHRSFGEEPFCVDGFWGAEPDTFIQ